MKPGFIYRITNQAFDALNDVQEITDISDNDNLIDDGADAQLINLNGTGEPSKLSTLDNNEDPFTVIKALQLVKKFHSEAGLNMNTFASGSDNRWSVHNYIGDATQTVFKGFLVLDDMSERFMFDPNEVVLTANDGLGLLKDIPLTDFDGRNPSSYNRIIDYIAWCLSKTGLQLQINCAFNIKNKGLIGDIRIPGIGAQHFFEVNYLDAKTFENTAGTCINCYQVLEYILGEEAEIFQAKGMWWIVRKDEREHPTRGLYISTFDSYGTFIENLGERVYNKIIQKEEKVFFSKEETNVVPSRPLKSVELDFDYEIPLEIPDNVDFIRGSVIDDSDPLTKTYQIDDWDLVRWNAGTITSNAYIKRVFNVANYEIEKYVVITPSTSFETATFLRSKPIYVGIKDRLNISVDFRFSTDISGGSDIFFFIIEPYLIDDNGKYWQLLNINRGNGYEWSGPFTSLTQSVIEEHWIPNDIDDSKWRNISYAIDEMPANGRLYVGLMQPNQHSTSFDNLLEIHYSNLSVEYHPFINGSYTKFKGQSQTVTQDGNYKAKRKKPVYISDSPKRLFKGSLHQVLIYNNIITASVQFTSGSISGIGISSMLGNKKYLFYPYQRILIQGSSGSNGFFVVKDVIYVNPGDYTAVSFYTYGATVTNGEIATVTISEASFKLSDPFYNAALYPAGYPDITYLHPYSEIQVFDVWNQFKNDMRVFQLTAQGIDLGYGDAYGYNDSCNILHKYFLNDVTENTVNRIFSLLWFDQNFRNQEWTGLLRETFNFTRDKNYTGRVFKYET